MPGVGESSAMIMASSLGRRYGRRWALIDVSFEQPNGSVWLLAGANGSGKSTLLRLLASAIRIDRGNAAIDGIDVGADPFGVRSRLSLLSHNAYTYEALTAMEHLRIFAQLLRKSVERTSLRTLLERVGLQDRGDDPVSGFSAGMRKRLSLARVLLQDTPVVLLDEPYGQLDPAGLRFMDGLIASLRVAGRTVLVASHQIERISRLADHALVLNQGRVVYSGPPRGLSDLAVLRGSESGTSWS